MNTNNEKLPKISRLLHIMVAIGIVGMMAMGVFMAENQAFYWYGIHKSIGVLILALAAFRVILRINHGWPKPLTQHGKIQVFMSKVVHWTLLISTILFPLSGAIMSASQGRGLYVFGVELLAKTVDLVTGKSVVISESLSQIMSLVHANLMPILLVALALHIAGALKAHFVSKDATLTRMF